MQANQVQTDPGLHIKAAPLVSRGAQLRRAIAATLTVALLWLSFGAPAEARRELGSVADLAESLQAAVVNISTSQTVKGPKGVPLPRVPEGSPFEELFRDFFNNQRQQGQPRRVNSLGSGFVIDEEGLIVTNNHVIEEADEIIVSLNDGQKLKVLEVVGRDSKTDLAVLRVKPEKPLTAVKFGSSDTMRVGDWVMAIGNPFGLGGSVTVGILSAKKRDINAGPYDEFLQTDAAINRGNSGGPLFNMAGEVIGINTAIISPTGGSIGIGFAVPADAARHVIDQLRKYGETRRGWLGVRIQTVTDTIAESLGMDEPKGALVASVSEGSPAEKAGIVAGDVILLFDGEDIDSMRSLPKIVAKTSVGKTVKVVIMRENERKEVDVNIGRLTEQTVASRTPDSEPDKKEETKTTSLLGLSLAPLSDEMRSRFDIEKDVKGVIVTKVEPGSGAAQREIKEGDVIMEVTRRRVESPDDVKDRINEIRQAGRLSALLLINKGEGDLQFVALPIEEE